MQAQLDKSAGQLSRVQKEKENIQQEMERLRDKHDKNQASWKHIQARPVQKKKKYEINHRLDVHFVGFSRVFFFFLIHFVFAFFE